MSRMLKIQVKLFGVFRNFIPDGKKKPVFEMEVENGTRIIDVSKYLGIPEEEPKVFIRNHRAAHENDLIADGDVIAFFPPIGGG